MGGRLTLIFMIACGFGCSAGAGDGAEADRGRAEAHPPYLALGDSIAFGHNPFILDKSDPTVFRGYPDLVAQTRGLALTNAACPGEASGSFFSSSALDNGCRDYRSKPQHPLHVQYDGTQGDFAVAFLRSHPDTALVTIGLGGNDLLLLRDRCNSEAACELLGKPKVLFDYGKNLEALVARLRQDGRYAGTIVGVLNYPVNPRDLLSDSVLFELDTVARGAYLLHGARIADTFKAFILAVGVDLRDPTTFSTIGDLCARGFLIRNPDGSGCDVDDHPSPAGHQLLADAVRDALD
jgi:lysophospholipase L1-like esterase